MESELIAFERICYGEITVEWIMNKTNLTNKLIAALQYSD